MNISTPTSEITILVVGDDQASRTSIASALASDGYQVHQAQTSAEGGQLLRQVAVDLVILDLHMEQRVGLETAKEIQSLGPDIEIIIVTPGGTIDNTLHASLAGRFWYLTSPWSGNQLLMKVQKAVERKLMRREITMLRQHVAMSYGFDNIVGISRHVVELKEMARRVAPTDITILLTGPSGTGKELFARAIHHHSARRAGRFVAVDCSAIPEMLLDEELFGQSSGAGAAIASGKKCLIEEADGGTLFFDDVSTIPLAAQAKLLRFLQDAEIKVPGTQMTRKVDVRIIAATSRDLKTMVDATRFREDLYFRLSVIPLYFPPLAERTEDIEMLAEYFLRRIAHEMKGRSMTITRQAVDKLLSHKWPGNVRELENTLKRAAALCIGDRIDAHDIMFIGSERTSAPQLERPAKVTFTFKSGKLDSEQRSLILKTLSDNKWNFTRTAQELGIGRTTLWRKVKKYNLNRQGTLVESEA